MRGLGMRIGMMGNGNERIGNERLEIERIGNERME